MRVELVGTRLISLIGWTLLLALSGSVSCSDSAGNDGSKNNAEPITMQVLGHGTLTARYSAEVWTRGNYTYTTTWGTRGASLTPGNAIYI